MYERDVVVKRKLAGSGMGGPVPRGVISGLSRAATRRLVLAARNVVGLVVMLTLTYPAAFPVDGRRVKRDWATMRKWLVRRGVAGLWFLEFQARGAPHIHVFLTGPVDKCAVAHAWCRIVNSGDPRHLVAGTRIEWLRSPNAVGTYAAKYAAKREQKEVPEEYISVGRFWGMFGGLRLTAVVVDGHLVEVKGTIRIARRAYNSLRRAEHRKQFKDGGKWGFTAYNVAPAMRRYIDAVVEPTQEGATPAEDRPRAGYRVKPGITRIRAAGPQAGD